MKKLTQAFVLIALLAVAAAGSAGAASRLETSSTADRGGDFWSKTQLSAAMGGTFVSDFSAFMLGVKGSQKLPVNAPLYGEAGLSTSFNGSMAIFPMDIGARYNFSLPNSPALTPFAHLSLGPAFATQGSLVLFHMFMGPGLIYRMSRTTDLRVDAGLVLVSDNAGFQLSAGISL